MKDQYFITRADSTDQEGPFTKEELLGKVRRDTLVWKKGMHEWKKASELEELFEVTMPSLPNPNPIWSFKPTIFQRITKRHVLNFAFLFVSYYLIILAVSAYNLYAEWENYKKYQVMLGESIEGYPYYILFVGGIIPCTILSVVFTGLTLLFWKPVRKFFKKTWGHLKKKEFMTVKFDERDLDNLK